MFGELKKTITEPDSFREALIVGKDYTFVNDNWWSPSWIIKWRLVQITGDICVMQVLENKGTWDITVIDGQCKVPIRILQINVEQFNIVNQNNDVMSLIGSNTSNVAEILWNLIDQNNKNQDYIKCKEQIIKNQELLIENWNTLNDQKKQEPMPTFLANPRITLRDLLENISSFLNNEIKPEDIDLVKLAIQLCMEYHAYDIEKIKGHVIDSEYGELLIKAKMKWIEIIS